MRQQSNLRDNLRKILKMRGRYMALFALLLVAFSNPLWSAELDTVWSKDFIGGIRFQHPITNNLVLEGSNKLIELDSENGNFLRELPYTNVGDNKPYISKDGTKLLHTNLDDTYIYEYPSMELIIKLDTCIYSKFINNDEVILRKYLPSRIVKYNIITKEEQFFKSLEINIRDIATSPDGRFIAYSTLYKDGLNNWSRLYLLDAKTMTQIALLEDVKTDVHYFERMSFSEDGKYLATNASTYGSGFQRNIYSTETLKSVKNYNTENFKTQNLNINFLNNNLYCTNVNDIINSKDIYTTQIYDIHTNNLLLTLNNVYGAIFYSDLNYLYYYDDENKKNICINISKLITGVSSPQPTTIVKYQNKQLIINKENVRNVEITDISGRVILNKIIENPFSNNTILPINLINGQYLIKVITDKESFTNKLMVLE